MNLSCDRTIILEISKQLLQFYQQQEEDHQQENNQNIQTILINLRKYHIQQAVQQVSQSATEDNSSPTISAENVNSSIAIINNDSSSSPQKKAKIK